MDDTSLAINITERKINIVFVNDLTTKKKLKKIQFWLGNKFIRGNKTV